MTTAIIGTGGLGSAIARQLGAGGESLRLSSPDTESTRTLAAAIGQAAVVAVDNHDSLQGADAVVLALRFSVLESVIDEIADPLADRLVVVPSNPVSLDAQGNLIRLLPEGQSSGEVVAGWLPAGARLAMAFGSMSADLFESSSRRTPAPAVLFYLTDDLRVVSLFWGDPQSYVDSVHDAGGLVMHTVGSVEEARRAVGCGVDIVVAQGWEAGGHVWSGVATLPLVPAVVDAVAPVPVIAAGGIGDARGVAAVFALGAQAALLGTRFLLADEMPIHEEYRRRLIAATEIDVKWYPDLYAVGWPDASHRAIHNSTAEMWEAAGRPALGSRPREGEVMAHFASGEAIVRYEPAPPMVGTTGEIEPLSLWAGQSVALATRSQPAAEIVAELVSRL